MNAGSDSSLFFRRSSHCFPDVKENRSGTADCRTRSGFSREIELSQIWKRIQKSSCNRRILCRPGFPSRTLPAYVRPAIPPACLPGRCQGCTPTEIPESTTPEARPSIRTPPCPPYGSSDRVSLSCVPPFVFFGYTILILYTFVKTFLKIIPVTISNLFVYFSLSVFYPKKAQEAGRTRILWFESLDKGKRSCYISQVPLRRRSAGVAQLVEQLICNQQVGGSNPSASSKNTNLGLGGGSRGLRIRMKIG